MLTKHRLGKRPLGYALLYGQKMSPNFGKLFFERYFLGTRVTFKEVPHKELYDKRCTTAFELIPYQ